MKVNCLNVLRLKTTYVQKTSNKPPISVAVCSDMQVAIETVRKTVPYERVGTSEQVPFLTAQCLFILSKNLQGIFFTALFLGNFGTYAANLGLAQKNPPKNQITKFTYQLFVLRYAVF